MLWFFQSFCFIVWSRTRLSRSRWCTRCTSFLTTTSRTIVCRSWSSRMWTKSWACSSCCPRSPKMDLTPCWRYSTVMMTHPLYGFKLHMNCVAAGEGADSGEAERMDQQGKHGHPLRSHHSSAKVQACGWIRAERASGQNGHDRRVLLREGWSVWHEWRGGAFSVNGGSQGLCGGERRGHRGRRCHSWNGGFLHAERGTLQSWSSVPLLHQAQQVEIHPLLWQVLLSSVDMKDVVQSEIKNICNPGSVNEDLFSGHVSN